MQKISKDVEIGATTDPDRPIGKSSRQFISIPFPSPSSPMAPRLPPATISTLAVQILRSLNSPHSPPLPSLPLPLPAPLILSVLHSSPSPLLSLRFFLHASTLRPSPHSLALFSSHLLPSLPHLLSQSPPPFSPSLPTFRAIFSLFLHPGDPLLPGLPALARNLLDEMQSGFGCIPDTFCYNTVIRVFVEYDRAEDALCLYRDMCGKRVLPNLATFVTLVKGLARAGNVEAAHAVVSEMAMFGCTPNAVVYTAFVDGLCSAGELDMAFEVLGRMEHELGKDCEPNVVTYTCLMKCLCDNGCMDDVLGMLDRMGKRGIQPNRVTVRTILKGFCIDEHSSKIQGLVDSLVGKGGFSVRECYSLIATCFAKSGRVDEAKLLITRMLENGIEMDALAINSLLRGLCQKRQFLDGYYWLRDNGYDSVDSDVYSCLLAGLCKERFIKEAVDMGKKIVEKSIRVDKKFVDCIIEGLNSFGEYELANQIDGLKEFEMIPVQKLRHLG